MRIPASRAIRSISSPFYDKPFLKFERLIETYLAFAPKGFSSFRTAMPIWISEKLFQKDLLLRELSAIDPGLGAANKLMFSEHHLSHAASAFYPSPFEQAAILTSTVSASGARPPPARGRGQPDQHRQGDPFPHSLGLLYSAFTYYTGFKVNSDEYKVMGLAPYGEPRYVRPSSSQLIDLKPDGSFRLEHGIFRLLHRADDDERERSTGFSAARRASRRIDDAARDGSRGVDSGGDRGGRASAGRRSHAKPGCETCAWPAVWR